MAATKETTKYAIISLGGKQYVVREGERLLVDRIGTDEGLTFNPGVLFVGGDGAGTLAPRTQVTARVVGHVRGEKVRIGKYRPKKGYRRHTGFRASLTRIEIEAIGSGGGAKRTSSASEPERPKDDVRTSESPAPAQPPKGYEDYTIADIQEKAKHWRAEQVEAALAHERAHANRKGAIAALEATLEAKREKE